MNAIFGIAVLGNEDRARTTKSYRVKDSVVKAIDVLLEKQHKQRSTMNNKVSWHESGKLLLPILQIKRNNVEAIRKQLHLHVDSICDAVHVERSK